MSRMTERPHPIIFPGLPLAAMLAVVAMLVVPSALAVGPDAREDPAGGEQATVEEPEDAADNSFCYVCHVNWKKEPFVEKHRLKGVSCCDCHGDSDDHMDDEEGNVAPEIMISKDEINASCMKKCHTVDKLVGPVDHAPYIFSKNEKLKLCTECHKGHQLDKRTRVWDQETGELVEIDGRAVEDQDPH